MQRTTYRARVLVALGLAAGMAVGACAPAATPYQQAQRQHEIACLGGTGRSRMAARSALTRAR